MKRKRTASLGCLFWIALILLVLVIFLFNRRRIESVMKATGFVDIISTTTEEPEVEHSSKPETPKPAEEEKSPEKSAVPAAEETTKPGNNEISLTVVPQAEKEKPDETVQTITPPEEKRLRRATLYFVFHDGSKGELRRVIRPVYYSDSPLTDTLKALLEGPSSQELNQNLITLVPRDASIRSVAVRDRVAYIDMTEAFRFNAFGFEGAELQLQQIIFTATEFPTVDKVQFLIEGVKQQYLNPEGLYIGKPLGRDGS